MDKYGILLTVLNDGREAGLLVVQDNGIVSLRFGEMPWPMDVSKEILGFVHDKAMFGKSLYEKYEKDILEKMPDETLKYEACNISMLLNSFKMKIQGYPLKAQAVTFLRDLADERFIYYEEKYIYDIRWVHSFKACPQFGHLRFKTVYKHYFDLFSIPINMIDIVSHEEFARIDRDRIPLFLGMSVAGVNPRPHSIPGFFNGNKLLGIVGKSLSGVISGLALYFVPEDIDKEKNEKGGGVSEFIKLAFY